MLNLNQDYPFHCTLVTSQEDLEKVGQFRLKAYEFKKPYMVNALDSKGLDILDNSSKVFAAWINNQVVATVRLSHFPFESSDLIDPQILQEFLGQDYQNQYLEWSRLLINPEIKSTALLPSLIYFAGMHILKIDGYPYYFGYSTPIVRKLFSRFGISSRQVNFTIPSRGEHKYYLLKGSFFESFMHLQNKDVKVA